jgi:hypothetical protein
MLILAGTLRPLELERFEFVEEALAFFPQGVAPSGILPDVRIRKQGIDLTDS